MSREKVLEVKNLSVSFRTVNGKVQAVRDISFTLYQGETHAIVGESGSGKSVTTKAIMGISSKNAIIESGEIWYKGQDLLQIPMNEYHNIRGSEIALIFQDPLSALNPVMKIGKQIMEPMILKQGMSKEEAYVKTVELMNLVGIPEPEKRMDQFPFHFSGGMRQRIVIAIALACNAKVLICDEPTTALDVTIQAQILELITRLQKERGLSVIFITHDLGVVASISDRVSVMYAGKIVETGTNDEIFYDPRHPYTWALLSSMPDLDSDEELFAIPGTPPNMIHPPVGDAFAPRNKYAMEIDFEEQPPMFHVSGEHYAATWLLHPDAPEVELPSILQHRLERMSKEVEHGDK